MGVYTKTGDGGTTGLFTGERVDKDSMRVEAYGSVDEANSFLGMARAVCHDETVKQEIYKVQKINMLVMAELASNSDNNAYITLNHILDLEKMIDLLEMELPPLNSFIIPGDTQGGAALDLARSTVRRAERRVITLKRHENVAENVIIFLNRLSDLCFVLMRYEER